MASGSQMSTVGFGGIFIGIWLYIAFFGVPQDFDTDRDFSIGGWTLWGFIGLLLAGVIYGTRIAVGWVRVALYALLGIVISMLAMAFFFDKVEEGLAALVTLLGGGLIVSVLPVALREQNAAAAARYE